MFSHTYKLDFELEKAKNAASMGKKVVLFIGRGSRQGVSEQADSRIHYCFLSPSKENFLLASQTAYSELMITLNKLPLKANELFDEVIIDGGTVHHLIHELQADEAIEVAALELANEIRYGELFDTSRIAASPAPMIYQIEPLNLSYQELLLRRLAGLCRNELNLVFPYGQERPWRLDQMQETARILSADPRAQIKELSILTWYLMSRKDCQFNLHENSNERARQLLPLNPDIQDKDSPENGSLMFKGSLGYGAVAGLKRELRSEAGTKKTP